MANHEHGPVAARPVLVVGASGLVGRQVMAQLDHSGIAAAGADLAPGQDLRALDACDRDAVDALVGELSPQAIIHLAAPFGLTAGMQRDPWNGARVNLMTTLNIVSAAGRHGVRRVVHASSGSVYLGTVAPDGPPSTEELRLATPDSLYAATKLGAEHLGVAYGRLHGFGFTSLRYPRVVEPRTDPRTPHELALTAAAEAAVTGRPTTIQRFTAGEELISASDAARAAARAATAPGDLAPAYNVPGTPPVVVEDVVDRLVSWYPATTITIAPLDPSYPYRDPIPPLDGTLAQRDLGYLPRSTLDDILRDYVTAAVARNQPKEHA